ncbi:hypothetical protein EBT25_07895, partial [bacterium]|nr:hypothetical protein [bacterium]
MNSPESRKAQENSFNQEYLEKTLVKIQEIVNKWEDICLYAEDEDETSKDRTATQLEKEIEEIINNIIEAINRLPDKTISREAHNKLKKIELQLQEIQNQVLTNTEAGSRAKEGIRKIKNVTNALENKIATLHKEKDPTAETDSDLKEETTDKINPVNRKIEGTTKDQPSIAQANNEEIEPDIDSLGTHSEEAPIVAEPDPTLPSGDTSSDREKRVEASEKETSPNQGARIATADGASIAREILERSPNSENEITEPGIESNTLDEGEITRPDNVALAPIEIDLTKHFSQTHAIAPEPSAPRPKSLFG